MVGIRLGRHPSWSTTCRIAGKAEADIINDAIPSMDAAFAEGSAGVREAEDFQVRGRNCWKPQAADPSKRTQVRKNYV